MKNKLIFYGELCPKTNHGISISNYNNLKYLDLFFEITRVEEYYPLEIINSSFYFKIRYLIRNLLNFYKVNKSESFSGLYCIMSTSIFGIVKTLIILYLSKRKHSNLMPFVFFQRSDFIDNYSKYFLLKFFIDKALKKTTIITLCKSFLPNNNIFQNAKIVHNCLESEIKQPSMNNNKAYLYLSHYSKLKGFFDIIEAFTEIDLLKLDCYGEPLEKNVNKYLSSFSSNNISVKNGIYGTKKFELMCNYKCIVIPSHMEGQPTILLEAMMLAIPVIVTNVGDVLNMLPKNYPFVYEAGDIIKLKNLILNFEKLDQLEINKIGKELQEVYYAKYSIEIQRESLKLAFENLIL